MTSSTVIRRSDFSQSSQGKLVNRLLTVSLAMSTISFGLSMARFGFASVLVIPAIFAVTLIHHITIWCLLAKYKKQRATPQCPTPPCLKHAGHIWPLALISLGWFGGGLTAICVVTAYNYDITAFDVIDITSGSFAILEGVIMVALLVICWRALSREGYNGIECACGNTRVTAGAMGSATRDAPSAALGYGAGADSLEKLPA